MISPIYTALKDKKVRFGQILAKANSWRKREFGEILAKANSWRKRGLRESEILAKICQKRKFGESEASAKANFWRKSGTKSESEANVRSVIFGGRKRNFRFAFAFGENRQANLYAWLPRNWGSKFKKFFFYHFSFLSYLFLLIPFLEERKWMWFFYRKHHVAVN